MSRPVLPIAGLALIAIVVAFIALRSPPMEGTAAPNRAEAEPAQVASESLPEPPPAVESAEKLQSTTLSAPITDEDVQRWIADTDSLDARTRVAAIVALGEAPRARALPALSRVLEVGEPEVDRHIALRSLHRLAMQQGDKDGKIRDALRDAVYHGEDENVAESAQAFIDDIETELAERAGERSSQ